jgi:inorganic phosphate transporter, PiT family
MGLIMLILIGTVPTAYALNRALPSSQIEKFTANSAAASKVIEGKAAGYNVIGNPRPAVTNYVAWPPNAPSAFFYCLAPAVPG